jgi:hypothetical protein
MGILPWSPRFRVDSFESISSRMVPASELEPLNRLVVRDDLPLIGTPPRAPRTELERPRPSSASRRGPASVMNTVVSLSRYGVSVELSTRPGELQGSPRRGPSPAVSTATVRSNLCGGLEHRSERWRAARARLRCWMAAVSCGAQGGLTSTRRNALLCGCDRDALGLILRPALETLVGRRHVRLAERGVRGGGASCGQSRRFQPAGGGRSRWVRRVVLH